MTFRITSTDGSESDKIVSTLNNLSPDALAANAENHPIGSIVKVDRSGLSDAIRLVYIFLLFPMIWVLMTVKDIAGPIGVIFYIGMMAAPIDMKKYQIPMIILNLILNGLIVMYH